MNEKTYRITITGSGTVSELIEELKDLALHFYVQQSTEEDVEAEYETPCLLIKVEEEKR